MGGHASRQKYNLLKMNCFCSVKTVNRSVSAFYDILLSIIICFWILSTGHLVFSVCEISLANVEAIQFISSLSINCGLGWISGVYYIVFHCGGQSVYQYYLNLHLELSIVSSQWGNSILFLQTAPAWEDVWFLDAARKDCPEIQFYKSHLNKSYHTN